ncbi:MAG TPA: DUF6132 family protein [Flavobacteriales bacterium]|nr:DUF6132 family protein [Flavobacteriales bacterium]
MKKFIKTHLLTIIGATTGAIAGYLYWKFDGCNSGSCPITSKPINSSLYGALLGGLFFSIFSNNKNKAI